MLKVVPCAGSPKQGSTSRIGDLWTFSTSISNPAFLSLCPED